MYAVGGRGEGGRQLGDLRMLHSGDGKKRLLDRDYMHGSSRVTSASNQLGRGLRRLRRNVDCA